MKKVIYLLLLTALLSGCGSKEAPEIPTPESPALTVLTEPATEGFLETTEAPVSSAPVTQATETQIPEETLELSYDAYQVVYNILTEGGEETAEFQGIGPDGNLLWTYRTDSYPMAQLSRIIPVGSYENQYYLIEGSGIVALDITTGAVLFENTDFTGSPGPEAMVIDDYGYLYLAGYDGPDFFAMDPQGHTVKQIPDLSSEFCRPARLLLEGDRIAVYMESDSQGNTGNFPCYVEMDWLPQAKG